MLQQETLKCFPIPFGSESEKDCQQFSSLTEIHLEELQNKTATFLARGWGRGQGQGEGCFLCLLLSLETSLFLI